MIRSKLFHYCIIILLLTIVSCKKEYSLENVRTLGSAIYSLQDSTGTCLGATVNGVYKVDSTLADSNYVSIRVNFISTGTYRFSSDTVNGMWFMDSGYIASTGLATIKLKGYGQPLLADTSSFIINNNPQACGFSVAALPALDYLPITNASTWRYQYIPAVLSAGGTKIDSFDVTIIPPSILFNTKTYLQYDVPLVSLNQPYYYAKLGSDYWEFGTPDFDYTFVFDTVRNFKEYIYLKDNQPVNTTWETDTFNVSYGAAFSIPPKTGTAKDVFTIQSVALPHTVGGITFQNVIAVHRVIMFQETGGTGYNQIMDGVAWYAKGVGLIDQAINLPHGLTENIPLLRYSIK